jgi:hypothetical protein
MPLSCHVMSGAQIRADWPRQLGTRADYAAAVDLIYGSGLYPEQDERTAAWIAYHSSCAEPDLEHALFNLTLGGTMRPAPPCLAQLLALPGRAGGTGRIFQAIADAGWRYTLEEARDVALGLCSLRLPARAAEFVALWDGPALDRELLRRSLQRFTAF